MTKLDGWVELFFFVMLSLALLFIVAVVEYSLPFFLPSYVYLLVGLLGPAFLVSGLRANRSKLKFAVPGLFVCGLVLIYASSWNSRKLFLRDLYSIRPGMSIEQVENIMERYNAYSIGGPNTRRLASGGIALVGPGVATYRHAVVSDGEYSGDVGVVKFKNAKVSSVDFLAD